MTNENLDNERLAAYVAGALAEADELACDRHAAVCVDCARRLSEALVLDSAVAGWNARSHGRALALARLDSALAAAEGEATDPAWLSRLRRWRHDLQGRAEAALRVVTGDVPEMILGGLDGMWRSGTAWDLAYAKVPERTRGIGAAARATEVVVESNMRSVGHLAVDGSAVTATLTIPESARAPLVMLVPEAGAKPIIREPKWTGRAYEARFENVPAGRYLMVFEPLG